MEETLPAYNAIDIAAVIILLTGLLIGLKRGLSAELAGVISAAAAVWAGWTYYEPLGELTYAHTRLGEEAAHALSFVAAVSAVYILMLILRFVLRHLMEFTFKGKIERIGGALSGLLRTAVVTAAVIFMMGLWPHDYLQRVFAEESLIGRALHTYLPPAYEELAGRHPELPRLPRKDAQEESRDMPEDGERSYY